MSLIIFRVVIDDRIVACFSQKINVYGENSGDKICRILRGEYTLTVI